MICIASLVVILLIPTIHSYRDDRLRAAASNGRPSQSHHLKTVEHSIDIMDTNQASGHGKLDRRQMKRDSGRCSQERLDALLRSCEEAASFIPTSDSNSPLFFCGSNCSHLAITYANECSGQELLVNISGACKLESNSINITIECIYAVVIVKQGITSCTKMLQDVESTHEDLNLSDSTTLVEEKCCSLQTEYESDVMHSIHIDRDTGRLVTSPALEPPWLRTDSNAYEAIRDVLRSELCTKTSVADTEATEYTSTSYTQTTDNNIAIVSAAMASEAMASGAVTHLICRSCLCLLFCFTILSHTLIHMQL